MRPARLAAAILVVVVTFAGGVAYASHDFDDVPTTNPFHDDISWLTSTGVTEGFPDGTYRPGEPVTRQSMAAFLRRLAGADPAVDPVVNAAELQGRAPAELLPRTYRARQASEVQITGTAGTPTVIVFVAVPGGRYVVDVSGAFRTTYGEIQVTCTVTGGTVLTPADSLTKIYGTYNPVLPQMSPISGTAVVDLAGPANIALRCHGVVGTQGPFPANEIFAQATSIVATQVRDL